MYIATISFYGEMSWIIDVTTHIIKSFMSLALKLYDLCVPYFDSWNKSVLIMSLLCAFISRWNWKEMNLLIQCGAIITRLIFSQIFTKYIP